MALRMVRSGLLDRAGHVRCHVAAQRPCMRRQHLAAGPSGTNSVSSASALACNFLRAGTGTAGCSPAKFPLCDTATGSRLPALQPVVGETQELASGLPRLRSRGERRGRERKQRSALWLLLPVAFAAGQSRASAAEAPASAAEQEGSGPDPDSTVVFTTAGCPFCKRAKSTLGELGVPFREVSIDSNPALREALVAETGRRTAPVVFLNGAYLGGADELDKLVGEGRLPELLKQSGAEVPKKLLQLAAKRPAAADGGVSAQQAKDRAKMRLMRLEQVAKMMARGGEKGVARQDARAGWATHRNAFSGAAAVEWFLKYLPDVLDSSEAVDLGREMQETQLLHHVTFSEPFAGDSSRLYRLHQDEPPVRGSRALNSKRAWLQPARNASEVAEGLRAKVLGLYDEALSSDGRSVSYKGLPGSEAYNAYVEATEELQTVDLFTLTRPEKMAFWLNIYNALVIHAMVEGGTPARYWDRLFFYSQNKYHISGQDYSLDDIEHGVLRGNKAPSLAFPPGSPCFKASDPRRFQSLVPRDPRIHFALNCGAKSCPPIKVYTSDTLDEGLNGAAAAFCEGEVEVRESGRLVVLSKILDWYKGDFGSTEDERLRWLLPHVDPAKRGEISRLLESGSYRIEYKAYDWDINE